MGTLHYERIRQDTQKFWDSNTQDYVRLPKFTGVRSKQKTTGEEN